MLIKFFRHGNTNQNKGRGRSGGGKAVKDYLLGKDGKRENARVIKGDPDQTTEIINGIKGNSLYTSAVLSFSKDEIVSEAEKLEIINSLENTLFPNMTPDQVSGYWVEHTDKDRLELHFVYANVELQTGKALPVFYAKLDKNLTDTWQEVTNDRYVGLISPKAPDHKKTLTPTKGFELKDGFKSDKVTDEQQKAIIHEQILSAVEQNPNVKTREDIVKTIQSLGYEVTRQGKIDPKTGKKNDSISIKNPLGGRNLKLQGDLYAPDFDRKCLSQFKEQRQNEYNATYNKWINEQKIKYANELEKRANRFEKRFNKLDRTPLDNELTKDLGQIRAENEPIYLAEIEAEQRANKHAQAKETLSQYDNRTLDPYELAHYTALNQSQLEAERLTQLKVIADIEYRVASGDELTSLDEAEYSQAKAFTNSVDTILEQQRQAQEQAEQARLEAQRLADQLAEAKRKQSIIKEQVNKFGAIVCKILPPTEYQQWERLFTDELIRHRDSEQIQADIIKDTAGREVMPDLAEQITAYQSHIDTVATIDDITATRNLEAQQQAERDRLAQEQAKFDNTIKSQIDTLQSITVKASKNFYEKVKDFEPSRLEQIKATHTDLNQSLLDRAGREVISDFDNELNKFTQNKKILATIDHISREREREHLAKEKANAPTTEQVINDRLAQLELDLSTLDPQDIAEFRAMIGIDNASHAEVIETETILRQAVAEMEAQARDLSQPLTDDEIGTHQSNVIALSIIDDMRKSGELELKQKLETAITAQQGKIYYGEVIAVNDSGAYQQTLDGIIVHPMFANSDKKVGTGYKADYKTKLGSVYFEELVYVGKQANKDKSLDQDPPQQKAPDTGR